jgi:glycosyltransferase involved in cell wall biosynthesis
LTFIPTDPASLAAAIATILDNEPLRRELASRGCARAAGFRWSQCAQRTLAVYERVLGTPLRDASE